MLKSLQCDRSYTFRFRLSLVYTRVISCKTVTVNVVIARLNKNDCRQFASERLAPLVLEMVHRDIGCNNGGLSNE